MKNYLIRIEHKRGAECITIYGDTPTRPFTIANNLWNYKTPGGAARQLERIAKCWEINGASVTRIYGSVQDMPTKGNDFNIAQTLHNWRETK